jgi:small-conductance mechanosensitive channel
MIGVQPQTPYEKLVEIREIVQEVIESQPQTSFDRVDLKELGASVLRYEVVYYVLSADHNVFMETQHAVNLGLVRRFAQERIAFA